ncbi:MAG: hydrogenase maturation protease [Verrucomicrobiales bacterium]|nr:hydrogenase maturation protease [Verrucomicrobiales bacterium]
MTRASNRACSSPRAATRNKSGPSNRSDRATHPALLVIGYGNTLRGDDAAGPRVAEAVEALRLPGVRVIACHQLTPELAEPIAQADRVVFVDAAVAPPRKVRLRRLTPRTTAQPMSHATDPRALLTLARELFGRVPRAWWLTIPAVRFDFGESLSATTRRGIALALKRIQRLAAEIERRAN